VLLAEELFQELRCVGNAVWAVTEDLPGTDTLKEPATGCSVPLLELLHEDLHPGAGEIAVLRVKAENYPGANEGSAGSFHVTHAGSVGPGDIEGRMLREAYKVAVGADHSLRAVMGVAALFLGCKVLT